MQIRKKLSKYQQIMYIVYILPVFGLMSVGQGSDYLLYRIIFPICMIGLILKLAVTDYTKTEWIWMLIIGGLLVLNLICNHEKTLVLTYMAIIGAKNTDLDKIIKWALWERIILTVITIGSALLGITNNQLVKAMPKYINGTWQSCNIYCYGYAHPNHAFLDLFTIALLLILVYHEKMKWYGYLLLMIGMYTGYYYLVCRTGWYTWICCFLIFIVYQIVQKSKLRTAYLYLVSMIPVFVMVFSVAGVLLYHVQHNIPSSLGNHLNDMFTGRFGLAQECYPAIFTQIIGHIPRSGKDLGYIHLIYNYGWIITAIGIVAYIRTMWKAIALKKDYLCLALAVMSGYLVGEVTPLNVGWNILWIYLSMVLFQSKSQNINIIKGEEKTK